MQKIQIAQCLNKVNTRCKKRDEKKKKKKKKKKKRNPFQDLSKI